MSPDLHTVGSPSTCGSTGTSSDDLADRTSATFIDSRLEHRSDEEGIRGRQKDEEDSEYTCHVKGDSSSYRPNENVD